MTSYLAYFDRDLLLQVATGIVGSEVTLARQESATAGFNFKVIFTGTSGTQHSTKVSTDRLLPEQVADAVYRQVPDRAQSLEDVWPRLLPGNAKSLMPGTPLLLRRATLGTSTGAMTNAGEDCVLAPVSSGDYQIRALIRAEDAAVVDSLTGQPVEILGVLRYVTPYLTQGAASLNLGFRLVAAWLK